MFAQTNVNQPASRINTPDSTRVFMIIAGVVAIVGVLGIWSWRSINARAGAAVAQAPEDTLTTTLNTTGFAPAEITHAPGRIKLKVNNQSGQQEIILRLSNANGDILSEVRVSNKVRAWIGQFDLGSGNYTLSEVNHPGWTCHISIATP